MAGALFKSKSDSKLNHAAPRKGHVLSTAVEQIAAPLRKAANVLEAIIQETTIKLPFDIADQTETPERLAWSVVSVWSTAIASRSIPPGSGLTLSMEWFVGKPIGNARFWQRADACTKQHLIQVGHREELGSLLPYLFDAHGPGSRLSVRRDPLTRKARIKKKAGGVFYTPADVADFMVRELLGERRNGEPPKVFDPAVGTGVFLRATLERLRAIYPQHDVLHLAEACLFGADIDALALDGAAYVLLYDVLKASRERRVAPIAAWKLLRKNLVCCDALKLDLESSGSDSTSLGGLWPSLAIGADVVLGNPPYAEIGARGDLSGLAKQFVTVAASPHSKADLYPPFIEQMLRLSKKDGRAAMVVPLSLACNSGRQFTASRNFIQSRPGTWSFAFFDREPHALFGEDVKTRNAIVFWRALKGSTTQIRTGPLRKWRGDTREALFRGIDYTPIRGHIGNGIPKLHGALQAAVWASIRDEQTAVQSLLVDWGRTNLDQLPSRHPSEVLVGPTAYNYLNVARTTMLPVGPHETLSTNPLHRLVAANADDALCIYAVMSSNFAFWWWHINGDGFHVNCATLRSLPIGFDSLQPPMYGHLKELGERAWQYARRKPIRSLNRARVSFSFAPSHEQEISRKIDAILIQSLGLPIAFNDELSEFVLQVVNARLFEKANRKRLGV